MTYRPEHFVIEELVPPDVFQARGQGAWELLDPRILMSADAMRKRFGAIVVNNWHKGGAFEESGFRGSTTATGARYSQHKYGRALDCKPRDASPREVFEYILAHPDEFPYVTTLEDIEATPTWVHIDCRNNPSAGIRIVKP